jgi:hypothetical protein
MYTLGTELRSLSDHEAMVSCADLLRTTPGTDPLAAKMSGQEDRIPDDGFLIRACVSPGTSEASVDIAHYRGRLEVTSADAGSEGPSCSGSAITRGQSTHTVVLVGGSSSQVESRSQYRIGGQSISKDAARVNELSPGYEVISRGVPSQRHADAVYRLYSYDPGLSQNTADTAGRDVELVRTVASTEEATKVFLSIADSLGLDERKRFSFVTLASAYAEELVPGRHHTSELSLGGLLENPNLTNLLQRLGSIAYPPTR